MRRISRDVLFSKLCHPFPFFVFLGRCFHHNPHNCTHGHVERGVDEFCSHFRTAIGFSAGFSRGTGSRADLSYINFIYFSPWMVFFCFEALFYNKNESKIVAAFFSRHTRRTVTVHAANGGGFTWRFYVANGGGFLWRTVAVSCGERWRFHVVIDEKTERVQSGE